MTLYLIEFICDSTSRQLVSSRSLSWFPSSVPFSFSIISTRSILVLISPRKPNMVLPTFVLLPLYIYPLANDYNWEFVTTALETYPSLQFTIIINPESGSGGNGSSYPVSDYIDGIANLTAYSNANLVGYVDTAFGDRSLTDVETDIRTCESERLK